MNYLTIRIDEELCHIFVEACREQDRPAAQVVREFMRRYVAGEMDSATQFEKAKMKVKKKRTESKIGRMNGTRPANC